MFPPESWKVLSFIQVPSKLSSKLAAGLNGKPYTSDCVESLAVSSISRLEYLNVFWSNLSYTTRTLQGFHQICGEFFKRTPKRLPWIILLFFFALIYWIFQNVSLRNNFNSLVFRSISAMLCQANTQCFFRGCWVFVLKSFLLVRDRSPIQRIFATSSLIKIGQMDTQMTVYIFKCLICKKWGGNFSPTRHIT